MLGANRVGVPLWNLGVIDFLRTPRQQKNWALHRGPAPAHKRAPGYNKARYIRVIPLLLEPDILNSKTAAQLACARSSHGLCIKRSGCERSNPDGGNPGPISLKPQHVERESLATMLASEALQQFQVLPVDLFVHEHLTGRVVARTAPYEPHLFGISITVTAASSIPQLLIPSVPSTFADVSRFASFQSGRVGVVV